MLVTDNLNEQEKMVPKKKKRNFRKNLHLLPHIFTLGNSFFGFCSIIFSAKGDLFFAAYFILLGAFMDALDGRIARMVGSSSDFGVQLDSLSDAISFCLAPAVLVYCWQLKYLGFLGVFFSAVFLLTGILRLARFNIIHTKQSIFFVGLPTTIAGCFLSAFLLNFLDVEKSEWFLFFTVLLVLGLSFLMVSKVKFVSFKKKIFKLNKGWYALLFVVALVLVSLMQLSGVFLLAFLLYFLAAFICALMFKEEVS